jgi:2-phosphosulfolactate phosphatase
MSLRLDVALVPAEAGQWRDAVSVVVDALRASTTIVTILDRGARAVVPLEDADEARRVAAELGAVLAGEIDGLKPPGYDFDNSPVELAAADLAGRVVVLRTSNGTSVIRRLASSGRVLVGCLPNGTAVAEAALGLAGDGGRVGITCAGRDGAFVLDDALVAGVLVDIIERLATSRGVPVILGDGADAARRLAGDQSGLEAGVRASASGRRVLELGLEADLARCLERDVSQLVPMLVNGASPRIERLVIDRPAEVARLATSTSGSVAVEP